MSIHILAEHIRAGVPGDGERCPLALAVAAGMEGSRATVPSCTRIYITTGEEIRLYALDRATAGWVYDFDTGRRVAPMSFDLGALIHVTTPQGKTWAENLTVGGPT